MDATYALLEILGLRRRSDLLTISLKRRNTGQHVTNKTLTMTWALSSKILSYNIAQRDRGGTLNQ